MMRPLLLPPQSETEDIGIILENVMPKYLWHYPMENQNIVSYIINNLLIKPRKHKLEMKETCHIKWMFSKEKG